MNHDEVLVRQFKPSILQFMPIFLMPLVVFLFFTFFGNKSLFFAAFWGLEILGILLAVFQVGVTTYSVTSKRIIVERGLFNRVSKEIPIDKATNFFLRQNFLQTPFGIGNIEIDTGGGAALGMTLFGVEKPREVLDFLFDLKGDKP